MKQRRLIWVTGAVLGMLLTACSHPDAEKTKAELRHDGQQASEEMRKAGREIQQGASNVAHNLDREVKPDTESASDKLNRGAGEMRTAGERAGVKLDQAALLARVKTRIASDAGLSTAGAVEVSVHGSEVTLSGTVNSEQQKEAAGRAAAAVAGVSQVHNRLAVER